LVRLLLIVIALLALVNVGLLVVPRLQQPATPVPGELIYVTTFDGFNDQWTQERGQTRTEVGGGALLISSDSPNEGIFSALDRDLGDFDLTVDARWQAVPDDYGQVAVIFRSVDRDNFYAFKLRADGAYRVEAVRDGAPDTLSEWQITPVVRTGEGAMNRIRIVGKAFIFTFYVNGEQLALCLRGQDRKSTWTGPRTGQCMSDNGRTRLEMADNAFARGRIALGAVASEPGTQVVFDNVVIAGPR
ncbi:MAG: hypothetical protein IT323_02430, partial [Anaerolineae bacterium]|nr:hypothetical protein [Anaerolineae bacterium]